MKRFVAVCTAALLLLMLASGILVDYFQSSLTSENLTFTGNQNITRVIDVYRHGNVTSAFLNLSGLVQSADRYVNGSDTVSDLVVSTFAGFGTLCGNNFTTCANNQVNSSYAEFQGGIGANGAKANLNWTINTKQHDAVAFHFNCAGDGPNDNRSLSLFNFTSSTWILKYNNTYNNENVTSQEYNGTSYKVRFDASFGCFVVGQVFSDYNKTSNVFAYAGLQQIWNYSGTFTGLNNKTLDFKTVLNNSLNAGACTGGVLNGTNCSINLTIHSDTAGVLQVSDIRISWLEYTKPNLTVTEPNTTYTGITYIPLNFTAIDDYSLDTCMYNVTRGASLEVTNTAATCSQNTTFTVSGDATYVLNMCINDTSNNQNCSSYSFRTVSYVPPPTQSGGGGGGGSTIIIARGSQEFSMLTDTGTQKYELQMIDGTVRRKNVVFESKATKALNLVLSCNGNLCGMIKFDDENVILPIGLDIPTTEGFAIELPKGTAKGSYVANLVATERDNSQVSNILTVQVEVGSLGVFSEFLNKLGASKNIGGTPIPYWMLCIFYAVVTFFVGEFIFYKLPEMKIGLSLVLAILVSFIAVVMF